MLESLIYKNLAHHLTRSALLLTLLLTFLLTFLFALAPRAFAVSEENSPVSSTVPAPRTSQKLLHNFKFAENPSITDAKIKTDAGSLSQYSLKFNFIYSGPTLGDLSAKDQPNPDRVIAPSETSVSGSLGGRYRLDSQRSIGLGTGIKVIHPFHGAERTDLNNPFISYNMADKLGEVQVRHLLGLSYFTVPNFTVIGAATGLLYDTSLAYDIGSTGLGLGLDSSFVYYNYRREYQAADRNAPRLIWALFPTIKYFFNDRFNLHTAINVSLWNPRAKSDEFALHNRTVSQRLGIGYSYSRDIYLAPYINFYPDKLSTDRTTLNFSTSFSIL